jgi:hypothetical protein
MRGQSASRHAFLEQKVTDDKAGKSKRAHANLRVSFFTCYTLFPVHSSLRIETMDERPRCGAEPAQKEKSDQRQAERSFEVSIGQRTGLRDFFVSRSIHIFWRSQKL